jgi:hypothetical protein
MVGLSWASRRCLYAAILRSFRALHRAAAPGRPRSKVAFIYRKFCLLRACKSEYWRWVFDQAACRSMLDYSPTARAARRREMWALSPSAIHDIRYGLVPPYPTPEQLAAVDRLFGRDAA